MFETVTENLKKRGFLVSCFASKEEAADYLDGAIDKTMVGFGGSVTLEQLNLFERLTKHNAVYSHMKKEYAPEGLSGAEVIDCEQMASVYLSSVNGLAETGEVINIDGRCNRVSSIYYGHDKVYLVVGKNKIAPDYERALFRARNVAAPKNAQRLNRKTPCAEKADRCYDCNSPERICRGLSVLWQKPSGTEIEVVLVNEDLGY